MIKITTWRLSQTEYVGNNNPHLTQEHSQAVQQPKKGGDRGQITVQASIFRRKLSKTNECANVTWNG